MPSRAGVSMDELRRLAASVVATGVRAEDVHGAVLRDYAFGGYVFFDRNAASLHALRALTDELRGRYAEPPLLAIDQEGGRVMRLREGVAPMESAAALGARGDVEHAELVGAQCAYDLRRAGCNLDFAPVLDLALDPRNTVIGDRSFGPDPLAVARIGRAFAHGLESGGVIATFKHFPGHGATAVDSHKDLPVLDADEAMLRARDLIPFAAIAREAHAMMVAHVVTPFDPGTPASISAPVLQTLLRDELGFGGVAFTDCLQMAAVAQSIGSVEAGLRALKAGADGLLVSHDPNLAAAIVERIVRATEEHEVSHERLGEAARRMHSLRALLQPPLPL